MEFALRRKINEYVRMAESHGWRTEVSVSPDENSATILVTAHEEGAEIDVVEITWTYDPQSRRVSFQHSAKNKVVRERKFRNASEAFRYLGREAV